MDNRDRYRGGRGGHGMFGYEGEGFMRGGSDYDDFARRGYGRDGDFSNDRGYNVGNDGGGDRGYGRGPGSGQDRGSYPGYQGGDFARNDPPPARGYRDVESPRQSYRGRGPKNYQRSDDRIREDVCERLSMDDSVDASELEVHVTNATVTLTGSVTDRWAKRRAEDIAEDVRGVKDVHNQIRISRGETQQTGNTDQSQQNQQ